MLRDRVLPILPSTSQNTALPGTSQNAAFTCAIPPDPAILSSDPTQSLPWTSSQPFPDATELPPPLDSEVFRRAAAGLSPRRPSPVAARHHSPRASANKENIPPDDGFGGGQVSLSPQARSILAADSRYKPWAPPRGPTPPPQTQFRLVPLTTKGAAQLVESLVSHSEASATYQARLAEQRGERVVQLEEEGRRQRGRIKLLEDQTRVLQEQAEAAHKREEEQDWENDILREVRRGLRTELREERQEKELRRSRAEALGWGWQENWAGGAGGGGGEDEAGASGVVAQKG